MWAKRFLYFVYYLKNLDWDLYNKFSHKVCKETSKNKLTLWMDVFLNSLKYNISILEYFQFHFYKINASKKRQYTGTGYMYEYQLKMNPKSTRSVLEDKLKFKEVYKPFIKHQTISLVEAKKNSESLNALIQYHDKIVLKHSNGQCGVGIQVLDTEILTPEKIINTLEQSGNDMVESYIEQHPDLANLSDTGLNTVRVITQLDIKNQVHLLGARLRITVNSVVDNLAAGNLAAPINLDTGIITGPAVYSDITKEEEYNHPITGVSIKSFQIPFWSEIIELTKNAALLRVENRSIGWDVAVQANGPSLLEGNHDWCKLLWQLPVKKGLKKELETFD
ncbi:MAG: hexapeptide transferase [Cyclobacteriaceae bacterium]|nr:hexapeptide transferase [Cyclobacteriaceae bacterium]